MINIRALSVILLVYLVMFSTCCASMEVVQIGKQQNGTNLRRKRRHLFRLRRCTPLVVASRIWRESSRMSVSRFSS